MKNVLGSFQSHDNSWFIMQAEFKGNLLCVRWEFLYEVLALQSTQSLSFTSSSKEAHDYPKFFSEL